MLRAGVSYDTYRQEYSFNQNGEYQLSSNANALPLFNGGLQNQNLT